jgi:hypothetical protein
MPYLRNVNFIKYKYISISNQEVYDILHTYT